MENATVLSVIVVEDSQYFADLTVRILKKKRTETEKQNSVDQISAA